VKPAITLGLFVLLFALLIFRYNSVKPKFADGDQIRINTRIRTEPIRYENSQSLRLLGIVRVSLPLYPEINYGDRIILEGVYEEGKLKNPKLIEVIPNDFVIYKARAKMIEFYKSSLPEPHSSLVAGVTIGSKAEIPMKFWEDMKSSGTMHVVVASGMNVTLVASFLMNLLVSFIDRRKAVIIAAIGIWIYALVSGFDAPIIRAAVMGTIAFSAQKLGKMYDAFRALMIAFFAMILINPLWIWDLGFVLSFAATASLMIFGSRIQKYFSKVPQYLSEGFTTSLAAQIGVSPILFLTFGQLNLASPLINGLVLWTIPYITIIGMISGLISLVFQPLARFILYSTYPLTLFFIETVKTFS
jgi:competence protein ComEC